MLFQNSQCFHPISGRFDENQGFPGETVLTFYAEVRLILILKIVLLYHVDGRFLIQTKEEDNCKLFMT